MYRILFGMSGVLEEKAAGRERCKNLDGQIGIGVLTKRSPARLATSDATVPSRISGTHDWSLKETCNIGYAQ